MKHTNLVKIFIVFFLLFSLQTAHTNPVFIANSNHSVKLEIIDAYYDSLNQDSLMNDVVIAFSIEKTLWNSNQTLAVLLNFTLTLPSGYQAIFECQFTTDADYILGVLYFYDKATEPGWYNINIDMTLHVDEVIKGTTTVDFDPPGEGIGAPPPPKVIFYTF